MTATTCRYAGDREQAIVSYVYADAGEVDRGERAAFEAHLASCDRCSTELAAFAGVRAALGAWSPPRYPENSSSVDVAAFSPPAIVRQPTWRDIPLWAQTAAAFLCLGIGAGIANLDVQYGPAGLHVRTGWTAAAPVAPGPTADAVGRTVENNGNESWRAELTALEQRLRADIREASARVPDASGNEVGRVRALLAESERRQQRELALRLGEALREVNAQRQEDLVRIDRKVGAMQSSTGREMLRQRSEMLNYVTVRTASQRGQ